MGETLNVFVCGKAGYKYTHIPKLREKYLYVNSVYHWLWDYMLSNVFFSKFS